MFVTFVIYGFGILVCAAETYLVESKTRKSNSDIMGINGYTPKRNPEINYGNEG